MYRLGFLAILLSSCLCDEDTLPVLLKFFHDNNKGDIGSLIERYENEAKGLIEQEEDTVKNHQDFDNTYKRSDQTYDTNANLNEDIPLYDINAYNPYNAEINNQNDNGIYKETTYSFDEIPQNTLVTNTNIANADPIPNPADIVQGIPSNPTDIVQGIPSNPADIVQGIPSNPADIVQGIPSNPDDIVQGIPSNPADIVQSIPYAKALEYEVTAAPGAPMDVSRNRKKYNVFQSVFDILDSILTETTIKPKKVLPTKDKMMVKKINKNKNKNTVKQKKEVMQKKIVSSEYGKQSKKDTQIVDNNIPVLNLNISLQDSNQKSIVLQIPINIYIGKNLQDDDDEEALSIEAFVYPEADKPILRSSDIISGPQKAKDIAMAKTFRDLIKKSRLQSKAKGELRRVLPFEDALIEPGINLNVK